MESQEAPRRRKGKTAPIDRELGRRIRALRTERGIDQAAFAAALDTSTDEIRAIEAGRRRIAAARLLHVARTLKVEVVQLFAGLPREVLPPIPVREDEAGSRELLAFFQACLQLRDADFKQRLAKALAIAGEPD